MGSHFISPINNLDICEVIEHDWNYKKKNMFNYTEIELKYIYFFAIYEK